jgi:hypothetical protein
LKSNQIAARTTLEPAARLSIRTNTGALDQTSHRSANVDCMIE